MLLLTVNERNMIFEKQGRIKVPWRLFMSGAYMRDYVVDAFLRFCLEASATVECYTHYITTFSIIVFCDWWRHL